MNHVALFVSCYCISVVIESEINFGLLCELNSKCK